MRLSHGRYLIFIGYLDKISITSLDRLALIEFTTLFADFLARKSLTNSFDDLLREFQLCETRHLELFLPLLTFICDRKVNCMLFLSFLVAKSWQWLT